METTDDTRTENTRSDSIETIDGIAAYRIECLDEIDPFLMTIVSNSDLWMFISSSGALTAGRVEPADCVFPYETDDRLHRAAGRVGPATVLRVRRNGDASIWTPFLGDAEGRRRAVLKSLIGNAVFFEEQHLELGFTLRYRWAPSDRFGWVRTTSLVHHDDQSTATVEVVDGLIGIMPWGIDVTMQQGMSNLANAYRRSEVVEPGVGIFSLESLIVDRPEPAEALRATIAWSTGLPSMRYSVDESALRTARRGESFEPVDLITGRPGAFVVSSTFDSEPGDAHRWHTVADVAQSQSQIARRVQDVRTTSDLSRVVDDDITRSSTSLFDIIASADGIQSTASTILDAHHMANALFNVMRGGTFPSGYSIDSRAFRSFVACRHAGTARTHSAWLEALPDRIDVAELRVRADEPGDADVARLAHEYLPLAFSRRHGDPSRPWNHFSIRVRDAAGEPVLSYQGNWRDIFQNWEALCRSHPGYLPSIIAKFVNASTGDGFNPYRVTSDGIDWEIPEPEKSWSGIGYWGDHQIVYLYRLLLAQHQHDPAWIRTELGRRVYSFARVPYRILPYERLLIDPKLTVDFDHQVQADIDRRVEEIGADGRLVTDPTGGVAHVSLLEKLLIPALAKLSNFVPRGGIWMNTQRPEWNDANNALVGYGLSMVTLAHLRRYLSLIEDVTSDVTDSILVSADVITWADRIADALESHEDLVDSSVIDDRKRGHLLHQLGEAFSEYRTRFYEVGPSAPHPFAVASLRRLIRTALRHLDDSLRTARRSDGLFDAYNLLAFDAAKEAVQVERLPPMLEGQVAAISSGLLDAGEVCALIAAMYRSDLHRPDIDTFMLYPATIRPSFIDRNVIPAADVEGDPLLRTLVDAGDDGIIERDVDGRYRFAPDIQNAKAVQAALDARLAGRHGELVVAHRDDVLALFERVFEHRRFTGRSSTMYAYEGIGSVYWHMVSKLILAVQEVILAADADASGSNGSESTLTELIGWYDRIRSGLGFNRTPVEYGAFPTDPYSHTPARAGAQQPGMTGQVKEGVLIRLAELGATVTGGRIVFSPTLLSASEFRTTPGVLEYLDVEGRRRRIELDPGCAAYTVCRVPVVLHTASHGAPLIVTDRTGEQRSFDGWGIDPDTSRSIFDHQGTVARIDVFVPIAEMHR